MQTSEQVRAGVSCWSCASTIDPGQPFCPSCGKLQAPQETDYFSAFGLPRKLNVDLADLESRFYRTSRKLHPDLYARATPQEQQWSLSRASLLNDAYRTLKDPIERTKYLLTLEGIKVDAEERGDSAAANPAKAPADLLEEVFELNMQLEELRMSRELGQDDPELRSALQTANGQFAGQVRAVDEELRSLWKSWDEAVQRPAEAGKTGAKERLAALLQRRNYLRNLVRDVSETLGEE